MIDEAKADGKVTLKEAAQIHRAQNEASRDIYQAKHDGQTRKNTPRADGRQDRQDDRIEAGVDKGQLTGREAFRLERRQGRISRYEARAKSDGVVTADERARLEQMQDRASAAIFAARHNSIKP
jgi:hypothetical protein